MELSQYGELFLTESREHVSAINHLLLTLEADPASREAVEGLFRSVHTIKGMSATMGYRVVADLAHEMENLMEGVRQGRVAAGVELVDLLFAATDALEHAIVLAVEEGDDHQPEMQALLERLRAASGDDGSFDLYAPEVSLDDASAEVDDGAAEGALRIRLRIASDSILPGVRAFLALRRARELGEVGGVTPSEDLLQEAGFDGSFSFHLTTELPADEIRAALLAVGEVDEVGVETVGAAEEAAPRAAPAGEGAAGAAAKVRNIRVDLRRLDALMNGVGELVIVRDRLRRLAAGAEPELAEAVDQASRLVGELQDEIMRARMAPVWNVFDRFPRLVRDAARSLGKQVDFVIEGKEIELDRSMLDEIGDPLVHLLRNSLDHGIEPPHERRAAGKPETGTLLLSAAREMVAHRHPRGRGRRGIQRDRVLRKAVALGLVAERRRGDGGRRGAAAGDAARLLHRRAGDPTFRAAAWGWTWSPRGSACWAGCWRSTASRDAAPSSPCSFRRRSPSCARCW
jgi:two-component system chemotaxis sensor kinase CheA